MKHLYLFGGIVLLSLSVAAQKKVLDHTVYDQWKTITERIVSNDGKYIAYVVAPQEGDGDLVIQSPSTQYKKVISRGYNASFSADSRYLICKIKPVFSETRQARIKKKKSDEMPKDSLKICLLGTDSLIQYALVKNYTLPEQDQNWLAIQFEKSQEGTRKKTGSDSISKEKDRLVKLMDSVIRSAIDSSGRGLTKEEVLKISKEAAAALHQAGIDPAIADADGDDAGSGGTSTGTDVVLYSLNSGQNIRFNQIATCISSKNGRYFALETVRKTKDSSSRNKLLRFDIQSQKTDTICDGFNNLKNLCFDESGEQLAFVAERDSSEKALQKFVKLWYFKTGQDSAQLLADRSKTGIPVGSMISEYARLQFSKNGKRLFFGTAPIPPLKDTTLVDFELARLDIWHYKDDQLQTQQLKQLDNELRRSYTAVIHLEDNRMIQLGSDSTEQITLVDEGNANWVLGESNKGNRIEAQWTGRTRNTAWAISLEDGKRILLFRNRLANANASPFGKFAIWFDDEIRQYVTWNRNTGTTQTISKGINTALTDEENDVPDFPREYGMMGWHEQDQYVYLYDRYDCWKTDPNGLQKPSIITLQHNPNGIFQTARNLYTRIRFINLDTDFRYFESSKNYLFSTFDFNTKNSGLVLRTVDNDRFAERIDYPENTSTTRHSLSKNGTTLIFAQENYKQSPDLYSADLQNNNKVPIFNRDGSITGKLINSVKRLSDINPQQQDYNWGTAELFTWKAYTGKLNTGILYKPENFDPKKKYPLICYFYERVSDGLNTYHAPAPTPSRLNISFFVSRGYLVLAPDIHYTTGHPGNDAYNHIVSGARAVVKAGWADSTRIGIQGQSWGGYQVAYLITKTKLFAAAWAGAPVANMTSAYGGIRWESGLNRQFQYEKQQSRIGATLWQKPQLYLENSPLFHLPNVTTPLAIMHNDADGAVPWYQGIELFTALRRLGKPVWMLNYNGEAHNLVERRNRKDIQIREQQFFDWLLKGEKPGPWITDGVPATLKGKYWGLE